jgi:SAM-dependent methyltransferase
VDIVEYNPANSLRHPWELARLSFVTKLIRRCSQSAGKMLILDIGCGDCFFSLSLLKNGLPATVIGIDPAYSAEELQKKRESIDQPSFQLYNSMTDASQHLKEPVDMVLLLDVIEHVPDDIAFLQELAKHPFIDANTRFIVTVPAYQSLFTSHDEFLLHYRRYNNRLLKKNLHSGGLESMETGYFFFLLLPVRILQKLKQKLFGKPKKNQGLGGWKHGKFLTGLVKGLLLFDIAVGRAFKKIGINLPGLSNYSICRKPVS